MGGHHKKNLRAEKAKVKLKGAKLPKGLNVTKTDFKVRKIVIREQLKETSFVDGERQLVLKEQLSRLKHCNMNARLDALRNIRMALDAGNIAELSTQLNSLIQGFAALCLDIERDVRRGAHKALGSLLATVDAAAIAPFFHIISSYLRCAMTHIQTSIQEDALLMLDVLLQHIPHLVVGDSEKIFQNFLEMISRVRADGDRANRTLTVNMGQRQTTIKWRTKVLQRLQQMFAILVQQKENSKRSNNNKDKSLELEQQPRFVYYSPNTLHTRWFSLKRHCVAEPFVFSEALRQQSYDKDKALDAKISIQGNKNETLIIRNYVTHLMPLLLEAWHEVRPQAAQANGNNEMLLTAEAAETLKIILEIMEHLWMLVILHDKEMHTTEQCAWLRTQYAETFLSNFLTNHFPHQQLMHMSNDAKKAKSKTKAKTENVANGDDDEAAHCLQQNLSIAHLFCRFYTQKCQTQSNKFNLILEYLNAIINDIQLTTDACLRQLIATLRLLLIDNGQQLLALNGNGMRQLLASSINMFLAKEYRGEFKTQLLLIICEILQQPKLYEKYGALQQFNEFLNYLPQLLLKSVINETTILAMLHLCKQQNMILLQSLAKHIAAVIQNIQKVQINGAQNIHEARRNIIHLFYWVRHALGKDIWPVDELLQQLDIHVRDKRIACYFRYILTETE